MMKDKLADRRGMTRLTFILLIAVILMASTFVVEGYLAHLRDVRMSIDVDTVHEAVELARMTYLSDGCPNGITYYYDAVNAVLRPYEEVADIEPYGLSAEKDNKKGETGALGIPNLPGKGGAQLLAIAFEDENSMNVRWQGNRLTAYDTQLMTPRELDRLTDAQRAEIELSRRRES